MSEASDNRGRSRARRLAVQAVYQMLVGNDSPAEVVDQFITGRNTGHADVGYFREMVTAASTERAVLEELIDPLLDRPLVQLDPVEHAILLLSMLELRDRMEVPFRVVLDEAVELARLFGAEESYKFINAVLDRAAASLRAAERG
jgi:transcription antitermination protein NusB